MVLESLFNPLQLKKHPWEIFLVVFVYSILALFISYIVFKESAGLLTVFLIVIMLLPMLYTTIKEEEALDAKYNDEVILLKKHSKMIAFVLLIFIGITCALAVSYVFLPQDMVNTVFALQHEAIGHVNANVDQIITGNITKFDVFTAILINNLRVLFFSLIFSFLFGTGALFILAWNGSVVAVAMGNLFKQQLAQGAAIAGIHPVASYFSAASFSFFRYMTHGVLEIGAYLVAGLAGGIISVAVIKHKLKGNEVDNVLSDSLWLFISSIIILVFAGLVEVYISQSFFL